MTQLEMFLHHHAPRSSRYYINVLGRYPDTSGYSEPTTSKAAAERVDDFAITKWLMANLPGIIRSNPDLTAKELSSLVCQDKDLVKPRLSMLRKQGKVYWPKDEFGKFITRDGEHVWHAK